MSGWIDTIWCFAVGGGGWIAALYSDGDIARRIAAFAMISAWALRLGGHIGSRTRAFGEDPRYAKLIEDWGDRAAWRLFLFLQIQAFTALVLVLSVYFAATKATHFPDAFDGIAMLTATIGLIGEAVSDAQLARFRKTSEAKTEICEIGLWRYSRHPNYFFEWVFWCSWPLLALSPLPWSWLSMLAPLLMYWLLVHVSGIPPLEEHMLRSRGEKFRALQARVSAFFPGPRKSDPAHQGKQS